ncbi:MAG: bifunctional glutamate N-acetyltransferase/amino-acid acetyltransferase ArgJ [Gammaproteobacteria bacterium]
MAVGLSQPEKLIPVDGVQLASTACGIRKNGKDDIVLISLAEGSACAAVFTTNAFCAAPVVVAREHLQSTPPRALLINAGNANAGTGKQGLADATQSCDWVAAELGCNSSEVLPFSTGVIGEPLPMEKLHSGISAAAEKLSSDAWMQSAAGIMTTDTIAKTATKQFQLDGKTISLSGFAKGSGMICPNMATMLAYVFTDAKIDAAYLQSALNAAVNKSFNAITVDGDTSTNDACILAATGKAGNKLITADSIAGGTFAEALDAVCIALAQQIVRDGEGATKFITVNVQSAATIEEARQVAYTIAHSPLVKTAFFASDPNWGRILAAVGRAGIENLDVDKVDIYLDDVCIVKAGQRDAAYTEALGQKIMHQQDISINLQLKRGGADAVIWTTDLSHDYVRINAEYRT